MPPGAPAPWGCVPGAGAGALRGANQSLPPFSRAGFSAGGSAAAGAASRDRSAGVPPSGPVERSAAIGAGAAGGVPGRGVAEVRSGSGRSPEMSLSAIGVRITTGGMGAIRGC
ncbi:hypothetical protein ID875_15365 [Streptomyces globisporus]|uniref:Uncharacterized protein n=1 Tax=Streptomyces globisporus TaxID=1908 RepID=A0A927GNC7_STRGL|nr:hypothetical protein [Streptomyces globisporus]